MTPISIVIPCYNEEDAIEQTIKELQRTLDGIVDYTLIVVDDGSTDFSGSIIDSLAVENDRVVAVHHRRNMGYGAALKTGIQHATTDLIAITDADGTYPNERFGDLVHAAKYNDMVVGSRTGKNVHYSWVRSIPKAFLRTYCAMIAQRPIPDMNSGMRVFRKSVAVRFFPILPDGFSFTTTITLAMATSKYQIEYVDIDYQHRVGRSKIKPIRDTINFFKLIVRTGMLFAPMRIFMPFAAILFLAFTVSASYDLFVLRDMTDKTVLLLLFSFNTGMFALIADMMRWSNPSQNIVRPYSPFDVVVVDGQSSLARDDSVTEPAQNGHSTSIAATSEQDVVIKQVLKDE